MKILLITFKGTNREFKGFLEHLKEAAKMQEVLINGYRK